MTPLWRQSSPAAFGMPKNTTSQGGAKEIKARRSIMDIGFRKLVEL
jgi:hypothetical protein